MPGPPLLNFCVPSFGQRTSTRIAKSFDSETFSYERRTMEAMPNLQGWWLRPLAVDAFARRLALQMQLIPAARATNWQQILSVHMPAPTRPTNLNLIVMALSEPRLEISEVMRIYFRSLSDLRAMSILLAADLYQSDMGAFPSHLQQLIPAYLPARLSILSKVPANPCIIVWTRRASRSGAWGKTALMTAPPPSPSPPPPPALDAAIASPTSSMGKTRAPSSAPP